MDDAEIANSAAVLFSPDGCGWKLYNGAGVRFDEGESIGWDAVRDALDKSQRSLVKIVIGTLDSGGGEDRANGVALADSLPDDLATRFPDITHLHLWHIRELTTLPRLPAGLECLDLRGCRQLEEIETLPDTLKRLDIGDCVSCEDLGDHLPGHLDEFYFNGCVRLLVKGFLRKLQRRNIPVSIIDGSGCPDVTTLGIFPHSVVMLVVTRCENLKCVEGLTEFSKLRHLNLSDCTSLATLPDLPETLEYIVLHGSENLHTFLNQHIGSYERGAEARNVLDRLLVRKKFGDELAIMGHAKVLLVGDGGVGKTTLSKRINWECLNADQRALPQNRSVKPKRNEDPTHSIRFAAVSMPFTLPKNVSTEWAERIAHSKGIDTSALNADGAGRKSVAGRIRIWDFGGQNLYHKTHRIFAREGSVFLLVWRQLPSVRRDPPEGVDRLEWEAYNERHSLDYWLAYIRSIRRICNVALVCTLGDNDNPDDMPVKPNWKQQAKRHAQVADDLPEFFVNSLAENCAEHRSYEELTAWISKVCGQVAWDNGLVVPLLYKKIEDFLLRLLEANNNARSSHKAPKHLLLPWADWCTEITRLWEETCRQRTDSPGTDIRLNHDDIETITTYFHEAGHLYLIRGVDVQTVLVDQQWATEIIYEMIRPGRNLFKLIRENGGWFYAADLEAQREWRGLDDAIQKNQLIEFMQECKLIAGIQQSSADDSFRKLFLVGEKWLLPAAGQIEKHISRRRRLFSKKQNILVEEDFVFDTITMSEFEFRELQLHLGSRFGSAGLYYRNGLLAGENDQDPKWLFSLIWKPSEDNGFEGTIDATLWVERTYRDKAVNMVERLFFSNGSPLERYRESTICVREQSREIRMDEEKFGLRGWREYDVAISSCGADMPDVKAMKDALDAAGFVVNWYQIPDCRIDEKIEVVKFMASLNHPPCIILVMSDDYLSVNDPEGRWYCAYELADAILRLEEGKRSLEQILVMYKYSSSESAPSDALRSSNVDSKIRLLLESRAAFFDGKYKTISALQKPQFEYLHDLLIHCATALNSGGLGRLLEARSSRGTYLKLPDDIGGADAWRPLVDAVEKATGKPARTIPE